MRISDWSSDVCSSDLDRAAARQLAGLRPQGVQQRRSARWPAARLRDRPRRRPQPFRRPDRALPARRGGAFRNSRSEEHTSELQSLMRISYAVFCLKQKKITIKYKKVNINRKQD